ncbi:hypothetical protein [Pedobacter psychroterrae]|uniref:Uncharacterized protein n=1 Tax=Pedobacter psychroterrae TaxID=2530453 RepID=A0A4V2ML25_9SPHI|nr:hypothetical protein [Pedobacter psychroterrae]TCD00337.1 hypothetical protein EZ437_14015 [Pedobacter psychroterrae]
MMKVNNTALFFIPLFIICVSCKKLPKQEETEIVPPDETGLKKVLLPVKLKSDKLTLTLDYQPGTALLTKISSTDKSHILITYKPTYYRVERFKDNVLYHYADFILSDKRATKVHSFDSFGRVDVPTGNYMLSYNTVGQLVNIKDYNAANEFILESVMSYSALGNLSELKLTDQQGKASVVEYSYDNKNGIFKNVLHSQLLFLETAYPIFSPASNNWLSCKNTKIPNAQITYSYLYNIDDYPSRMVIEDTTGKQTFDITYAELSN